MAYQSVNPNDGKLIKSFEHMSNAQREQSLAQAQTSFEIWKHQSCAQRAVIVNKAAALLRAHVDDFARLETLEMGKRFNAARGEVQFSGGARRGAVQRRHPGVLREACRVFSGARQAAPQGR